MTRDFLSRLALVGALVLVVALVVVLAGAGPAWVLLAVTGAWLAAVAVAWAAWRRIDPGGGARTMDAALPVAEARDAAARLSHRESDAARAPARAPAEPEERVAREPSHIFTRPRAVPPPPPEPVAPEPAAEPDRTQEREVVRLADRRGEARRWNLWDLERVARVEAWRAPARAGEWSYLFLHLRQFAEPKGTLPPEFDGLIRESFGSLLEQLEEA